MPFLERMIAAVVAVVVLGPIPKLLGRITWTKRSVLPPGEVAGAAVLMGACCLHGK